MLCRLIGLFLIAAAAAVPSPQHLVVVPNPCTVGQCVRTYLCRNGTINTDGTDLIDVRADVEEENPCPADYICCSLPPGYDKDDDDDDDDEQPSSSSSSMTTSTTTQATTQSTTTTRISTESIATPTTRSTSVTQSSGSTTPAPKRGGKFVNRGCGFRNYKGVSHRNSGGEANIGEFPWMVAILLHEEILQELKNVYQCGGALLHPLVVLTAAHCVSGNLPHLLKIRAGEWDTQEMEEILAHQERQVKEVIIHEKFNRGSLRNDVALLMLDKEVEIFDNVNTVCLPPPDFVFDGYQQCYISGWGKAELNGGTSHQHTLKRINLPTVARDECQSQLRETRLGPFFKLHKSFMCAGGQKDKDACIGDGGSPLVCPIFGTLSRYYHAGIVSWGIGCNDEIPGVYVNVAGFRKWIDNQMEKKNLDQSFYTVN